jgi:regulatory protein YycH of two-component signal transduction system YycFG
MTMDKMKSILLIALVVTSLFQSYKLAYSYPKLDQISTNEYIQPEMLGKQVEIKELLFPDQIVVHHGNELHSVLYPNTNDYESLLDTIKQRSFDGLRSLTSYQLNVDLEQAQHNYEGIELVFRQGLPLKLLQNIFRIRYEDSIDNDTITRIWIMKIQESEEIRALFFTDTSNIIYEVSKADFTTKDVENFIAFGDISKPYRYFQNDILLPTLPVVSSVYAYEYTEYSVEQLKGILFVDPGITRNIKERDGSEIYTDGKRGFRITQEDKLFTYTNPIATNTTLDGIKDQMIASVKFINEHGGWDASYIMAMNTQRQRLKKEKFFFQMFYGSYPVVDIQKQKFGKINVFVEDGNVTNYERSLLIPDSVVRTVGEELLISANEIEEVLKYYPKAELIVMIYPIYTSVVSETQITLYPVWAVELRDGTIDVI